MTAPGDYVLIFLLLALFLACVGYAAGRLHQRWQAAQDREEAYRDGYENGSSNVFSTAVRMLGPRRSARGAASVRAAEAASSAAASPAGGSASRAASGSASPAAGASASPAGSASAAGGSASRRSAGNRRAAPKPAPQPAQPAAASPSEAPLSPVAPSLPVSSVSPSPVSASASPASPASPVSPPSPASPASAAAAAKDAALFGFPAPEPPPPYAVTESAAVGGLLYRPFVDPRPADGSAPVLGDRTTYRALPRPREADLPRKPLGSDRRSLRPGDAPAPDSWGTEPPRADSPAPAPGRPRRLAPEHADDLAVHADDQTSPDSAPEESSGRHTVPDELVRAATYRLPPDRIFRAKVPDGSRLPEDPASLLGVPKPRQS
ncbi:MAG TPA: hypothetical protein VGB74_09805 [Actinoplanes sp.]